MKKEVEGKKRVSFMEEKQNKISILMFPWLGYSHVSPFLELSKRLSKRNFHIYFCSSAINLDAIKANTEESITIHPSIELIELHVPSLPELPPKFHTTKNLPPNLTPILLNAFQMSDSSFSEILDTVNPDLLIYDFFQPWAPKIALSKGIPSIYFATSGAAPFSFFYHMYTYGNTCTYPFQELYLLDHEKVVLNATVEPKIKNADPDFGFGVFKLSCDMVLIKGCKGFDGKFADYLSVLCQKKVISTGVLIRDSDENENEQEENSYLLQWLNRKEQFSTLYICFGSEHVVSKDQIHEIARGLEMCDVNFIWVLKFFVGENLINSEELLPEGFLERTSGRGIVVKGWIPQSKILLHPSIGGFVSHCGWSSLTESLYCGVPIIAMPIKYDQPINARLVVEAGVGVEVMKGENGLSAGEEIAKAIGKIFLDKSGNGETFWDRARNLSEKIKEEDEEAMNEVAVLLSGLCLKNERQELTSIPSSSS